MCIDRNTLLAAGFALAAGGAVAQPVTFSVASDGSSDTPTFAGSGAGLGDAAGNSGFELLIDDANGVLPTQSFADLSLIADFSLQALGPVAIAPGIFTHQYLVDGFFAYVDASGANILEAEVIDAVMTVIGSADRWFTSGAIVATDLESSEITYTWGGPDLAGYNLFTGETSISEAEDDGAFTLTLSDGLPGPGIALGSDGLPSVNYTAEASFSGSATFIPGPATAALLGMGGFLIVRRR